METNDWMDENIINVNINAYKTLTTTFQHEKNYYWYNKIDW